MNILTIDLEDWFHILAHEETSHPSGWEKFESRVEWNTEWILERLKESQQTSTFFCLGWIAKKYPSLIRKIAADGHEIACHSMNHQLVYAQNKKQFTDDLKESLLVLENISGRKVKTFRAPGFSVTDGEKWIFKVLAENGIENDCSVFPLARNHGGYKNFASARPCLVDADGVFIKEFPMSYFSLLGKGIIFSGGGYFRLMPYAMISAMIKQSDYVMTYFHPRDFDAGQPVLDSLNWKRKFMSYTGIKNAGWKFTRLLKDFRFVSVDGASAVIDWKAAERVPGG
jgi:polysaccharide deacetylase family protein (PEP-CTERM system associated)